MEIDDKIAVLRWLEDITVTELREAGNDIEKQKQAFTQYFLRGNEAQFHWGELWDYLSISYNNPLQRAGLYDEDAVFEATLDIIEAASDAASQMINAEILRQTGAKINQCDNEPPT